MKTAIVGSTGQHLLAELAERHSAAEVARRVGSSDTLIRHVAKGRKTPSPAIQQRLLDVWSIPLESWRTEASPVVSSGTLPAASSSTHPAPPSERGPGASSAPRGRRTSAIDDLADTIERLERTLRTAEADAKLSPSQLASLYRAKVDACDRLAKLRGEGELTGAMLMRSRVWKDLMSALLPVLEKHPAAAEDIATVLEGLEGP